MNKLSKFDFILFGFLIIVIGGVYLLYSYFNNQDDKTSLSFSDVSEYSTYFMVINNINDFISDAVNNNNSFRDKLDVNYVDKYGYNDKKISSYGDNVYISANEMLYVNVDDNFIFYVNGVLQKEDFDTINVVNSNFNIIMFLDIKNMAYSFYILDDDNYMDVVDNYKSVSVTKNVNNGYNGTDMIDDYTICSLYLTDFLNKVYSDLNSSYSLISGTTKDELFNDISSYKDYMNNNKDKFGSKAVKCEVNGISKRVYNIYDDKNNYYNFLEDKIMKYYVNFRLNDN